MSETDKQPWVKVWDPLVRYGHWALVVAFATAYLSAEEETGGPDLFHVWSGYTVGIIVAVRIVWGVVGTGHARFADFAYSPIAALRYFGELVTGRSRRYLGHSPIGAAMVVALLLCLCATVGTGLVAYGDTGRGPLAHATALVMIAPAHAAQDEGGPEQADGQAEKGGESRIAQFHATLANVTLGLVILHILGVGLASVMHRENLVAAMIWGKKRAEDGADSP